MTNEALEFIKFLLTSYGPIVLGWPIAGLLFYFFVKLSYRVLDAFIAHTKAMAQLTASFDELKRIVAERIHD